MSLLKRLVDCLTNSVISSQSLDISPINIRCKSCDVTVDIKNKNAFRSIFDHLSSEKHRDNALWTCIKNGDEFEVCSYNPPVHKFKINEKYRRLKTDLWDVQ